VAFIGSGEEAVTSTEITVSLGSGEGLGGVFLLIPATVSVGDEHATFGCRNITAEIPSPGSCACSFISLSPPPLALVERWTTLPPPVSGASGVMGDVTSAARPPLPLAEDGFRRCR